MGAILKTDEERIRLLIEESSKRAAKAMYEEVNSAAKAAETVQSSPSTGGSKISQILKNASAQQQLEEREVQKKDSENDHSEKGHVHNHNSQDLIDCPNCSKKNGSPHKLINNGKGKLVCTGDSCGLEYSLIPTKADYICTTCNLPHKKPPEEVIANDSCPFCNGTDFLKYDWSKVIKSGRK